MSEQPVVVNDQPISKTSAHKCLGVHIDEKLSWDCHVHTICKKVSAGTRAMGRIKNFVPVATLETVYKDLVQPYFEYCTPLWDTCDRFRSRAGEFSQVPVMMTSSADLIDSLFWQTLDNRRLCAKSILMYKILNDHTAPGLS